jgi:hypothetical protein
MRISQRALAKALGVKSKRTIEKRIAQGMPVDSIEAARAWCEQNLAEPRGSGVATVTAAEGSQGSQGSQGRKAEALAASEPLESDEDPLLKDQKTLNRMLTAARIKLTERDTAIRTLQERQADIEGRIRDGDLVEAKTVQRVGFERSIALRLKLMELPAQWALQLAAITDPALVADFTRKRLKAALVEFCVAWGVLSKEEARTDHPTLDLKF